MNSFLTAAAKVTRKEEKDQRMRVRRETEDLEYQERHRTTLDEDEDEDVEEDEEGEEEQRLHRYNVDYVEEEKKRKRCKRNRGDGDDGDSEDDDDVIWAKIPREILKLTAPAAMRMEFSHSDHVVIISAFLKACNVDLDEFPLSVSTSYRRRCMREAGTALGIKHCWRTGQSSSTLTKRSSLTRLGHTELVSRTRGRGLLWLSHLPSLKAQSLCVLQVLRVVLVATRQKVLLPVALRWGSLSWCPEPTMTPQLQIQALAWEQSRL
jgi:hypothetical protein